MDAQRALLDALMGRDRDLAADEKAALKKDFRSSDVCPYYLLDFCPNDLFVNTKSDVGPCSMDHDPHLRGEFQEAVEKDGGMRVEFERKMLRYCEKLVNDVDRRIRRGHQRLNLTPQETNDEDRRAEAAVIEEQITALLTQMETLGEEGKVDESQALMSLVEDLRKKKASVLGIDNQGATDQRMKVCDVCGALLVQQDAAERVQAHLEGKQHQGFTRLRESVTKYREKLYKSGAPPNGGANDPSEDRSSRHSRRYRNDRYEHDDDRYHDSRHSGRYDDYYRRDPYRERRRHRSRSPRNRDRRHRRYRSRSRS